MSEYDDILHLPHHVSASHPPMPRSDRAAQFAPFRALSGYEDDVAETARLTDQRIELDESRREALDARLRLLELQLPDLPPVAITAFRADECKEGGAYITVTGSVKKLDPVRRVLVMADGRRIAFDDIYDLSGELFDALDDNIIS